MFTLLYLHWGIVNARFVVQGGKISSGGLLPLDGEGKLPLVDGEGSTGSIRTMGSTVKISGSKGLSSVRGRGRLC